MPELDLSRCPFCDMKPKLAEHEGVTASGHYTAHVGCGPCGIQSKKGWGRTRNDANREAAAIWNRRPYFDRTALMAALGSIIDRIEQQADYDEQYEQTFCGGPGAKTKAFREAVDYLRGAVDKYEP